MQTVWTDDWSDSGLVNVAIDDTNIYIRTGFLSDGTWWNSKALGVDSSGNVVYVNANGNINNPLNFPAANRIPKINATQDGLETSIMFQTWWRIGVNRTTPIKSMDILGDFQVTTQGSSLTYQYQFFQSSTTSSLLTTLQTQQCACDTNPLSTDCSAPFTATPADWLFCVDIISQDPNDANKYFYTVYEKKDIWTPEPVLVTELNSVWIRTANPQAALHVSGNVIIDTIPTYIGSPSFALVRWPNNEVQKTAFPSWSAWEINNWTNLGWGEFLFAQKNWVNLEFKSLIAWSNITLSSTNDEITINAAWWSAGEANTASNLWWWSQIFSNKVWVDLRFRSILWWWLTQISQQADTITVTTPPQTLSLIWNDLSISNGNTITLPATWPSNNGWNLTGNAGISPGIDFLWTTDNTNFELRVNNQQIWLLYTNWSVQFGNMNTIIWNTNNATIGWGMNNIISNGSLGSVIGGWIGNNINWIQSTIPWWQNNTIIWNNSFAIWQNTSISHNNSFIRNWTTSNMSSTRDNQFIINSQSWTFINTNTWVMVSINEPALTVNWDIVNSWNMITKRWVYLSFPNASSLIGQPRWSIKMEEWWVNINSQTTNQEKLIISASTLLWWSSHDILLNPYGWLFGSQAGNVWIWLVNPQYKLHVNWSIAGVWWYINISDQRYKTNIRPINNGIQTIKELNGVKYEWNKEAYTGINFNSWTQLWLIAQDVEPVLPEVVRIDTEWFYSLEYTSIIPVLIQAIKEQQALIDDLTTRIEALEG